MLLTGCIEKGHIFKDTNEPITPTTLTQEVNNHTTVSTTVTKEEIVKSELPKDNLSIESNETISSSKIITKPKTEKVETDFFSSLSDETKNNISGLFVMLIGIIILL
jgi:predicted house-cleaning NTP pyrophosphatase (Maf/HAM1 superfamily)